MSSTISLPDSVSIEQTDITPSVTIVPPADLNAPPAGNPPYPLSANPTENWTLQSSGVVSSWVQYTRPPGQGTIRLEGGGVLRLESGGLLLMES
jgi:hypothetical protein